MFSKKEIIYIPKHTHIPAQDSPQCYFFSFLHLRAMHKIQASVSSCVSDIVQACKETENDFKKIMYKVMSAYAEDLIRIADEIIDENGEDYDGDWIEDFLDKYGVDFAMARLLDLSVTTFEDLNIDTDNFKTADLAKILEQFGPIAIRLTHGNIFPQGTLPLAEKIKSSNGLIERNVYSADGYQENTPHTILLIGVKDQPKKQVYFIDPNYPQMILSMEFKLFKRHMLMAEFVHNSSNTLKSDEVIFLKPKMKLREDSYPAGFNPKRRKKNPVKGDLMDGASATTPSGDNDDCYPNLQSSSFLLFNSVQFVSLGAQELGSAKLPPEEESEASIIGLS
ncbi:hypothetical protein Lche_1962 [Legionella cherrii]|uniref:Uncharacterized protein n=1 Tax=Legionella cherrii TaxID=28084 RepID=A0A0W0S963_9GAMM|nr:hypothetical protein [Legionella cherrii]KTC79942.1 hypothetical protein Lche_1962 [Legionella cherrii]